MTTPTPDLVDSLVAVWREVLNDPDLGPTDNFYLAGGNSVLAGALLTKVAERVGVEVSFNALLETQTPVGLAALLAGGLAASSQASPGASSEASSGASSKASGEGA